MGIPLILGVFGHQLKYQPVFIRMVSYSATLSSSLASDANAKGTLCYWYEMCPIDFNVNLFAAIFDVWMMLLQLIPAVVILDNMFIANFELMTALEIKVKDHQSY